MRIEGGLLPEGQALPDCLEDSFDEFVSVAKELWRPNDRLDTMIRRSKMEMGLGSAGTLRRKRKNSPAWGGNRRKGEPTNVRQPVETVEEGDHDFNEMGGAERADRPPIIGMFIRVGDKVKEWKERQRYDAQRDDLAMFLIAALEARARLTSSTSGKPGYSRSRLGSSIFPPTTRPKVSLMGAEKGIAFALSVRLI